MIQHSYSIAIHGGAGNQREPRTRQKLVEHSLRAILEQGRALLAAGGTALDTVVHCTHLLEDDPLYNAGYGAVPNAVGRFEPEACVMDGHTLEAGAVTNVDNVRNPIELARRIMEATPHVMLAGQGAADFAEASGLAMVSQAYYQEGWRKHAAAGEDAHGTVGAVARDRDGNLAAATSTGGQAGKLPGRVGDSPLIGAGTYADNDGCAVSCTGWGEDFIRTALAARVSFLGCQGLDAQAAAQAAIEYLVAKINGNGGFILVDKTGAVATAQSSTFLRCGWIEHGAEAKIAPRASVRIARGTG
ncbi:MAG TPA: isoaspartyl peptidase/L-asparaginase family protein [Nitrococcus sp.]|nr:isoaspartyl peptidase/L-asparaginase family protein [Nitrococcus sp.]